MFLWPISIYYEDTDAGGVVYHSNYLNFFERARSEWLKSFGVKQKQLLADDVAFVVKEVALDYKVAARFEQDLVVESKVVRMSKTSLLFQQRLIDDDQRLYCQGRILVVCVAISRMKPKAIPQSIVQEFEGGS